MEVFGYRKLVAYQKAKEVVKRTYKLLKKFPAEERYAMCDQLRRASVSITSNIAEGVNRYSVKDKSHFIEMSYGSLMEVMDTEARLSWSHIAYRSSAGNFFRSL